MVRNGAFTHEDKDKDNEQLHTRVSANKVDRFISVLFLVLVTLLQMWLYYKKVWSISRLFCWGLSRGLGQINNTPHPYDMVRSARIAIQGDECIAFSLSI